MASPPPPPLLFPDEATARQEHGYFCPATMPKPGERVDVDGGAGGKTRTATVVSSQAALQNSLYDRGGAALTPGFENADCTVLVRYDDDGSTATVSAAEKAKSNVEKYGDLISLATVYLLLGATSIINPPSPVDHWEDAMDRHDELRDELAPASSRPDGTEVPASGEYWGASEESDEGDQAVRTTLRFARNGDITGRGVDGEDGAYRIMYGRWGVLDGGADDGAGDAKPTVAWIEVYDQGFEVAVEGRYDAKTGQIRANFVSSRNIRGTFELVPKPSVF